jgi:hypothetical protein
LNDRRFTDIQDNDVKIGDKCVIAFSYSRSSVGRLRLGRVKSLEPFIVTWKDNAKDSPPMVFDTGRILVLW